MKSVEFKKLIPLLAASFFSTAVNAMPPAGTPYFTDSQNEYVQDATSDAIGNVNMILCIMNAFNVDGSGMLNNGPYIALVDINKCQSRHSGGSSDSSGASAASNYMTAVVNATRASNSDPMISKVWMSLTEEGKVKNIYVNVSVSQSPTDVPPYGVFRLDYIGKDPTATTEFNGFINSTSGNLQAYETGPNSSNSGLSMTATSTTSGSGTISIASPATTFNFNYNTAFFRRSDGTHDQCFDRLKTNAARSVWRYGTYSDNDGTRVDEANPSFQITATYAGNSYYGFAGYFGINFQGLDLNTIVDASPIAGLVVKDQRSGNVSTYNLSKLSGKLTKWTQNATTLSAMDGIPFYFNGDLTGKTTGSDPAVAGWGNWQMQWNNATANFTVIGAQQCSNNGCIFSALTTPGTVNSGALNGLALTGWSDSFGGNINIPAASSNHVASDPVDYYSQSLVVPGSASEPTILYCLNNCPSAASVNAANAYSSGTVPLPFDATTSSQWFSAPNAASTFSYGFGSGGLLENGTAMTINNAAFFNNNPMYQNGVTTGRLFATPFAGCLSGSAVCEPNSPPAYYTWSTGTSQWNQSLWLTKTADGSVVAFDPPQNIAYTVPSGADFGTWGGKTIQLQFDGFGNIQGIPGYCVNPDDNSATNCNGNGVRYVPSFSIPDGATMTVNGTALIVKALDEEIRLKDLGAGAAQCAALTLTPLTPPGSGAHDMTNPSDSLYIGVKPIVTASPKVIDGVVQ